MEDTIVNVFMHRPHLRNVPDVRPLPAEYTLRRLGTQDEPALARLLSLVFEEPWDERRVQTDLTRAEDVKACYGVFWQHGSGGHSLVATASSQLRASHAAQAGFVHWVAAHPEHRRKGLAAALVKRVMRDFQERGYESAWLVTQPARTAAIRAYLQFGFTPVYEVEDADHRACWAHIFQTAR